MSGLRGVISDFGGVLTNPLSEGFAAMQRSSGISLESLGRALARVAAEDGAHPLYQLETGRLSEREFLQRLFLHPPEIGGIGRFDRVVHAPRRHGTLPAHALGNRPLPIKRRQPVNQAR